jgi:hypothetical protein
MDKGHSLNLHLGYGDSQDKTGEVLHEECVYRLSADLMDVTHGGTQYGSEARVERFVQLAGIANKLWASIPYTADVVGLVESDLLWKPASLLSLIEGATRGVMTAPMVIHRKGGFYDTWAFVRGSRGFKAEAPYHPDLNGERYYDMDSVGTVFFMHAIDGLRLTWPEKDVVMGLCTKARANGVRIILDTDTKVYHP